jgi:hypothetical protein
MNLLLNDVNTVCIYKEVTCSSEMLVDFQWAKTKKTETKLCGLSPRVNYTDRATAACRRS